MIQVRRSIRKGYLVKNNLNKRWIITHKIKFMTINRVYKPCSIISMFDGVGMAAGCGIIFRLRTSSSFPPVQVRWTPGSLRGAGIKKPDTWGENSCSPGCPLVWEDV